MTGPSDEVRRGMALVAETDTVRQLLSRAIASINQRGTEDIDPSATMQLLSQGIERLLKLTAGFQEYRKSGTFPDFKREYSHGIERLASQIQAQVQEAPDLPDYRTTADDLHFIASDATLHLLLEILTQFSFGGRYRHLSVISGLEPREQSPKNAWNALEEAVRGDDAQLLSDLAAFDRDTHEAALREINLRITALVQRYIRFLARVWAFSPAGDVGKRFSSSLYPWLVLRDEELRSPRTP